MSRMNFPAKQDWEACKKRYEAWWAHEDFGRAGVCVWAPINQSDGMSRPVFPKAVEARWTDLDFIKRRMDYDLAHTYYGGDAFPIWSAGYPGWDALPVFLGCDVTLAEETGWWHPIMADGELASYNPQDIRIDTENKWCKMSKAFRKFAAEQSADRAVATTGAFGGCGDTLAAMRTSEQLLLDVADDPETVLAFEIRLMEIWCEHFDECYTDFQSLGQGSAGWFPLWSPRKFYATQCDFAYMISPEVFERCFLPAIDIQTRFLDHSIHHVDGIGNFHHVDALCSLPYLQALQILPGAGKPSPLAYPDVLKKVQQAGKNLHIAIPPWEVKAALDMLSSRGLMIDTWAGSEEEAENIVRYVEKNSR